LPALCTETKQLDAARETFKKGTKNCPTSVRLWLAYAEHEATFANNVQKARAVLETARLKVPKNPELWLAAIRLEQRVDNHKKAQQMIAQALQECPKSGILWAHAIASDARQARKSRTHAALNECKEDPYVFAAAAKLFWIDRKISKARGWFNRAVTVGPQIGDIWAAFYKFELEHGTPESQEAVLKRCVEADPTEGEKWKATKRKIENFFTKADGILKQVAAQMKDVFEVVGNPIAATTASLS